MISPLDIAFERLSGNMKELTAKKREKARADKEKTSAEPQDVEMKEDEQKTPKELDQLTLEGLKITYTSSILQTETVALNNVCDSWDRRWRLNRLACHNGAVDRNNAMHCNDTK